MKSMTGYGRAKGALAEAWARSVNGRFLEIRVHLPREWAELEPEIRTLAQSKLARGTVDLHVGRGRGAESLSHVEIDERLAKQWATALKKLAKATGLKTSQSNFSLPFEVIARAPDVIKVVNEVDLTPREKADVLKAAGAALDSLNRERQREGKAIQTELISLLKSLETAVSKVSTLAGSAPDDLRARLKTRMDRLESSGLQPPGPDDSRFHQEVAILIDRGDVREEITRLVAHLKVYRELVETKNSTAPIGKTLDFYAQELLREVNTVGSKSQTADMTRLVVEAKTFVEKIREQVQNVE